MVEKHGPDTSDHPPDDFDLWEEATGGKKKGKLVGLGSGGDPRVMVTRTSATSSSSFTSSEQVCLSCSMLYLIFLFKFLICSFFVTLTSEHGNDN